MLRPLRPALQAFRLRSKTRRVTRKANVEELATSGLCLFARRPKLKRSPPCGPRVRTLARRVSPFEGQVTWRPGRTRSEPRATRKLGRAERLGPRGQAIFVQGDDKGTRGQQAFLQGRCALTAGRDLLVEMWRQLSVGRGQSCIFCTASMPSTTPHRSLTAVCYIKELFWPGTTEAGDVRPGRRVEAVAVRRTQVVGNVAPRAPAQHTVFP